MVEVPTDNFGLNQKMVCKQMMTHDVNANGMPSLNWPFLFLNRTLVINDVRVIDRYIYIYTCDCMSMYMSIMPLPNYLISEIAIDKFVTINRPIVYCSSTSTGSSCRLIVDDHW